jgi:membrane fusion protein (multidrug efflux system)
MRKVVAIPVSALRKGPGGDQVFVVTQGQDGQTRVRARHVESGTMSGDEMVILEGLTTGEQVAAVGSFKLRDGALVAIIPSPESPSTGAPH